MTATEIEFLREKPIFEDQEHAYVPDPDETPVRDRRLFTQPYDLVMHALLDQIERGTLHLRPISDRPRFQRRYVWTDSLASKLIESILLNVPIPPCYLSQNEDYELDVIDGQQRIYSVYRFLKNQLVLSGLEVLKEHNGLRFFELPPKLQRKLETYTLRCVIITNDSDPEIRFDVFERLNSNTVPLNAQELRNCIYRGPFMDMLGRLAEYRPWLQILNRSAPDKRMRGEDLILRFFAFYIQGLDTYRTPQKHWLNAAAKAGRRYNQSQIEELEAIWKRTLENSLVVFGPTECFRRLPLEKPRAVINRALMDLIMASLSRASKTEVVSVRQEFYARYVEILKDDEFGDLITRAIDHKSRTLRRFELWSQQVTEGLF